MINEAKWRLIKVVDRHVTHKFAREGDLVEQVLTVNCFIMETEVFESVSDADHYRSLKDYPEDYIVIQTW